MRIVNEFNLANVKCTVFSHQSQFSLKLEIDRMEQHIKFREDSLSSDKAVIKWCHSPDFQRVIDNFKHLALIRNEMIILDEHLSNTEADEII